MTASDLIAVAVATLDRPDDLAALLGALDRQRGVGGPGEPGAVVVVVDNSAAGSAGPAVAAWARGARLPCRAVAEPRRGLSFARDAGLAAAEAAGATHVAFVDDDEIPHPDWLARLHARLAATGAAAAAGPVRPVFEGVPPPWAVAGGFFAKALPERGGTLADGYTCNAMVDLRRCRRHGILSFDPRCNRTGGEDTLFFRRLIAAGEAVVWAPDAAVYERMPPARVRPGWLMRRWYRTGGTEALLSGLPGPAGQTFGLARGALRIAAGLARALGLLLRHPRSPHRPLAALYTACRGAGLVAAAFGRHHAEYAPGRYRGPGSP